MKVTAGREWGDRDVHMAERTYGRTNIIIIIEAEKEIASHCIWMTSRPTHLLPTAVLARPSCDDVKLSG